MSSFKFEFNRIPSELSGGNYCKYSSCQAANDDDDDDDSVREVQLLLVYKLFVTRAGPSFCAGSQA